MVPSDLPGISHPERDIPMLPTRTGLAAWGRVGAGALPGSGAGACSRRGGRGGGGLWLTQPCPLCSSDCTLSLLGSSSHEAELSLWMWVTQGPALWLRSASCLSDAWTALCSQDLRPLQLVLALVTACWLRLQTVHLEFLSVLPDLSFKKKRWNRQLLGCRPVLQAPSFWATDACTAPSPAPRLTLTVTWKGSRFWLRLDSSNWLLVRERKRWSNSGDAVYF